MLAIKKILDDKCGIFVMTIDAVMDQVVPLSDIKNHKMTFKTGETLEEAAIAEEFVARGYEKAPFVEAPGEFAVRGGIIDIFPYTQESPYRIELWGDEIDSIRSFDKESQRSIEEVETLTIYPASEIILNQPRIDHGLRQMEEDYEKLIQKFKIKCICSFSDMFWFIKIDQTFFWKIIQDTFCIVIKIRKISFDSNQHMKFS